MKLFNGLKAMYPKYDEETFMDEVYWKGSWIRRLSRLAIDGPADSRYVSNIEAFLKMWEEHQRSQGVSVSSLDNV